MSMKFKAILAVFIFILIAVFFLQNTFSIEFKLYFWTLTLPLYILLPTILLIGFIIGYIVAKINRRKLVKQKVQKLQESIQTEKHTGDKNAEKI
jgi:uncharacterized integral membrane protein